MPRKETVEVGGLSLDLIVSGPGDRTEAPEAQGTEVTFSPGEIYGPVEHRARDQKSEAVFIEGLDPGDRVAYQAFKEDGAQNEFWLSGHMTAEGWTAYVAFKKYGEGGTLTHTEKGAKGKRFTEPPEGVLWG